MAFVVAVQDSFGLPLSVKVTGSPGLAVPVVELVSTADTGVGVEKLPETGWTASVVGVADTTVGVVAASTSSSTVSP